MTTIRRLLPASGIRAVFDRARQIEQAGQPVLHLEIGRPDWTMPPGAVEDAKQALDDGFVHYIANRGLPELRAAVAEDLAETIGRSFDPEREIIITSGSSEAISMVGLALLGPGDEVIVPEPAWNHYVSVVTLAGATPVPLPLSPADGFRLDPERVEAAITPRTRMIVVNSPGNPTGAVQPAEALAAVARLAAKHGLYVLCDEVYRDFVFDGVHVSIAKYLEDPKLLLYTNSFSKSYAMTGWRIGYVTAEPEVSDALNRVHQYLTVCGVSFAQQGAVGILRHPERAAYLNGLRAAFAARYAVWRDAFVDIPVVRLTPPGGAFYVFPRIDYRGMTGREFCMHMLEKQHVAMVPGDIFGEQFGQHVRISYGRDLETQRAAAARLVEVLSAS